VCELVPLVSSSEQNNNKFYLKHADDKEEHILVDEHFNVTGIIDCERAHTAPPSHAFNSPISVFPVADFYSGENSLSHDEIVFAGLPKEKGHKDLSRYIQNGRLQHRFAFCCGYDLTDWDGFGFLGLFEVFGGNCSGRWLGKE